jgi:purine-binding chemotaxis protein CheW
MFSFQWSECDMDILAARKKAAEQANARNKPAPEAADPETAAPEAAMPEAAEPAERPEQGPEATPAPAESGSGGITVSPAAADAAPVIEETGDQAGIVSVPSSGEPEETQQKEIEMLTFLLGGEEYAVLVEDVREVLKFFQLTLVPNTPDYILGVTSLRGTMLPIIDLCKRFGIASATRDEKTRIVVVNPDEEDAGLMVDRVTGVIKIMPDAIKPTPENIERGAEYLSGIVRKEDKLYILLDLEKAVGK